MRKMLIAALAGALVALSVGVLTGAGAVGTDDESTVTETTTETVEAPKQEDVGGGVREAGEDISGPCDEAEHANDPRCTGATGTATTPSTTTHQTTTTEAPASGTSAGGATRPSMRGTRAAPALPRRLRRRGPRWTTRGPAR